jgi:hypothetical protein
MESFKKTDQQFANGEVSLADDKSQHRSSNRKWIWVLVVLTVAIAGALAIIKRPGSNKNVDNGTATKISTDHSPGSEVFLYIEGHSSIMVAVDEESLDKLITALANRGEEVQALVDSGKAFTVPSNTRVRIEEAKFAKLKVRFIEGKKVMTEAWVPERWVR